MIVRFYRNSGKDGELKSTEPFLTQRNLYLLIDSLLLQHAVAENSLTWHTCRMSSYGIPEGSNVSRWNLEPQQVNTRNSHHLSPTFNAQMVCIFCTRKYLISFWSLSVYVDIFLSLLSDSDTAVRNAVHIALHECQITSVAELFGLSS